MKSSSSSSVILCLVSVVIIHISSPDGIATAFVPSLSSSTPTTTSLFAASSKFKVFIDGEAGTTGLQVRSRLESREDLEVISPPHDLRKDEATRKAMINEADAVILCLPDAASIEAASFVEPDNDRTVLIDASTAFRVDENWVYGFPGMFDPIRSVRM